MTQRTSRAESIIVILLAIAFVAGALLWMYRPAVPRSAFGWTLLVVIGIPTWALLEWLGGRITGARVFARLGSAARIALAVPIVILFLVFAGFLIWLGQRAIGG